MNARYRGCKQQQLRRRRLVGAHPLPAARCQPLLGLACSRHRPWAGHRPREQGRTEHELIFELDSRATLLCECRLRRVGLVLCDDQAPYALGDWAALGGVARQAVLNRHGSTDQVALVDHLRRPASGTTTDARHARRDRSAARGPTPASETDRPPVRRRPCPNSRFHPVEGGSANAHDYCSGDPVNCSDLLGLKKKPQRPLPEGWDAPDGYCGYRQINEIFYGDECDNYWAALRANDSSIYYDFKENGIDYFAPQGPQGGECPGWVVGLAQFVGLGDVYRGVRDRNFDDISSSAKNTSLIALEGLPAIGVASVGTAVDFACSVP